MRNESFGFYFSLLLNGAALVEKQSQAADPESSEDKKIRVALVEDSPSVLKVLSNWIEEEEGFELVGVANDFQSALLLANEKEPDIFSLDVNIPGGNGIQLCRQIMRCCPTRIVILTGAESEGSLAFQALRSGAMTLVEKSQVLNSPGGRKLFFSKLRLFSRIRVIRHRFPQTDSYATDVQPALKIDSLVRKESISSTDLPKPCKLLGIVASTGAPTILFNLVQSLPSDLSFPILVNLHIQPQFYGRLLEWLRNKSNLPVFEAKPNELISTRGITFCPPVGSIEVQNDYSVIFRPEIETLESGSFLLTSLAKSFGDQSAGLVLSGMGRDGSKGLKEIIQKGGKTAIQEPSSCVVPSMPEMALEFAQDELPIANISSWIETLGYARKKNE